MLQEDYKKKTLTISSSSPLLRTLMSSFSMLQNGLPSARVSHFRKDRMGNILVQQQFW